MPDFENVIDVVEDYQPLDPSSDPRWRKYATWDQGFELLCVIVMALASLAAAWSGFQASSWSGIASVDQTQSSALRTDATRASLEADVQIMKDMNMFDYWTTSYLEDDVAMANFYRARFSPELEEAMNQWLATNPFVTPGSAPSPFDLDAYAPPALEQAANLAAQADTLADDALVKLQYSDRYVMSTVILATVVFFGGLAAKLHWVPARITAISLAIIMLSWGAWEILRQPVHLH